MCSNFVAKAKAELNKILRTVKTLQKISRAIALLDAILGFVFVVILIVRRSLKSQQEHTWSDANIVRICLLSILGLQIFFSIVLYEGARRGILCLIKTWLIFCLIRLLVPLLIVVGMLILHNGRLNNWWNFAVELAVTCFHFIEAVFILSFHKASKKSQQNTDNLESVVHYKKKNSQGESSVRFSSILREPSAEDIIRTNPNNPQEADKL